jgi:hypothetical protein
MALLPRFDPPAYMSDLDGIEGLRDQWSSFVAQCFDETVASEPGNAQYYNAMKVDPGPTLEQEIPWNAFPKELLRRYGRERALREADTLWPLSRYRASFNGKDADSTFYRPLPEYCEWHVFRDPDTNAIRRVTFSSEPPEYWQALFGDTATTPATSFKFQGANPDRKRLLELYHELVSPEVKIEDLIAQRDIVIDPRPAPDGFTISANQYNIYNKWNTALGIAHLAAPPNFIAAEVQLGGDATVPYANAKGELIVEPDPLICCARYGGPDRNSDPTIGATVNALARLGAKITLRNPVGLYMDHIDVTGWSLPAGIAAKDCVRVVRGDAAHRMIERLVVEVPAETGYTVSDIRIGGEPIRYGGQIAECITVKLVGLGALAGVTNSPQSCSGRCCVDPADLRTLNRSVPYKDDTGPIPAPLGTVAAFSDEGGERPGPVELAPSAVAASAAAVLVSTTHHAHKRSLRAI